MRARGGLKEGAAFCSSGAGEGRKECGDGGGKSSGRREKVPSCGGELLDQLSHLVYTLSKLEQLRHDYVFPSAYFAPGMVISRGGEADSCRV